MLTRHSEQRDIPDQARPGAPAAGPVACAIAAGLVGGVTLAFLIFVWRNYYLKPYSDPYHWLQAAEQFPRSFLSTPLAPGFPPFLAAMMAVCGRLGVLLTNVPVLIALAGGIGVLCGTAAAPYTTRRQAVFLGVAGYALLLGYDPYVLIYLVNPYRDPLAFWWMALGILCWVRAVRSDRAGRGWPAAAGLLIGLGATTRETVVLLLPACGLYLLAARWRDGVGRVTTSAAWFGAGFLLGLAPTLLQAWFSTGQVLAPAYAVSRGRALPGLHVEALWVTPARIGAYFASITPWWFAALLVCGAIWAGWKRDRLVWALLAPALAANVLFYCFYWTMSVRYLFVIHLLLVPVAVVGGLAVIRAVERRLPIQGWGALGLALLCAGYAIVTLARIAPGEPRFRLTDARKLRQTVAESLPKDAVVFSRRHLCEVLDYCTPVASESGFVRCLRDGRFDPAAVRELVANTETSGRTALVAAVWQPQGMDYEAAHLLSGYNPEPLIRMKAADYGLQAVCGDGEIVFYGVRPWEKRSVPVEGPPFAEETVAVLRVDAGVAWAAYPRRTWLRLESDAGILLPRVEDGANYVAVPPRRGAGLRLVSDAPLPDHPGIAWYRPAERIAVDLRTHAMPRHDRFLGPEWEEGWGELDRVRLFTGAATLQLPAVLSRDGAMFVEFFVRTSYEVGPEEERSGAAGGPVSTRFEILAGGRPAGRFTLAKDRRYRSVEVVLEPPSDAVAVPLAIRVDQASLLTPRNPPGYPDGLLIRGLSFRHFLYQRSADLDVGSGGLADYLIDGWYGAERGPGGRSVRWTRARARVRVGLEEAATDYRVVIHCIRGHRPPTAPAMNFGLEVNGVPVPPGTEERLPGSRLRLETVVPRESLRRGVNEFTLTCTPWRPLDHGGRNPNRLGLMVDRIEIMPAPSPQRTE